ncbi:hypothetical protein GWI33_022422 [Rhynchophorus ferrugineus]|uniref:Uncharacterized protein n=1 Tax=Rhynchophorus ferrugineus TaxID=354439 RepID=A0A834MHL3_RHYFE|nr:hypothetical protein GWI33_022422 [Rhynchophorus ferrugineus]
MELNRIFCNLFLKDFSKVEPYHQTTSSIKLRIGISSDFIRFTDDTLIKVTIHMKQSLLSSVYHREVFLAVLFQHFLTRTNRSESWKRHRRTQKPPSLPQHRCFGQTNFMVPF